jgi:plasmid stabilization system protein ParE
MSVRVTPEAAADLEDIFRWYSDRNATIGLEFLSALASVLRRIDEPTAAPRSTRGPARAVAPVYRWHYARDSAARSARWLSCSPRS